MKKNYNKSTDVNIAFTGMQTKDEVKFIEEIIHEEFPMAKCLSLILNDKEVDFSEVIFSVQKPIMDSKEANQVFFTHLMEIFIQTDEYNPYFTKFKNGVLIDDRSSI